MRAERTNATVGANLKRLRVARRLTRVALAAKVGMDDSYLGKMERGQRGTTPQKYALLAHALGVDVGEFFKPTRRAA